MVHDYRPLASRARTLSATPPKGQGTRCLATSHCPAGRVSGPIFVLYSWQIATCDIKRSVATLLTPPRRNPEMHPRNEDSLTKASPGFRLVWSSCPPPLRVVKSALQSPRKPYLSRDLGALIIRIGLWGMLYYNHNQEPPNILIWASIY